MKQSLILSLFSYSGGGDLPFHLYDKGPVFRRRCERCSNSILIPDLAHSVLKLDRASRFIPKSFPDICATGIFHGRVVEDLRRAGCTGFRAYPMRWEGVDEWVEMMAPRADALEWPQYYRIEILGRVALDRSDCDPENKIYCPECGIRLPGIPVDTSKRHRKIPLAGTWDGSDFCVWRGETQGRSPLCSRRVIDLAAERGWTGAAFGHPTPGVQILSPVPANWLEIIEPKVRALHPDQFE